MLVADNQTVKAGQVLARIDDRDFRAALDQAKADVAAAEAAIRNLDAQIELQQSVIEQAQADDRCGRGRRCKFAQADAARYDDLMKTGSGTSPARAADRTALRDAAPPQLQRDQAALIAAEQKIDVLTTERDQGRGAARPRPRASSSRPSSISPTPRSPRRSTARSAPARSGSASMCRPARS